MVVLTIEAIDTIFDVPVTVVLAVKRFVTVETDFPDVAAEVAVVAATVV
jgi:hypothetical protein